MALRQLLSTVLRRWYTMVAALLAAALLVLVFSHGQIVYTTRTSIAFTYPDSSALDPFNGTGDKSLISFVSTIAQKVNGGKAPDTYADLSAPFYGAGIRQGVSVSLPNDGNQFISIYRKAQIDIDIVGPTFAWVQAKQDALIAEVANIAEDLQVSLRIPPVDRLIPAVVPLTLPIVSVGPSRSAVLLAAAGLGIAAVLVGGWGAVVVERLSSRRRAARDPHDRSVRNRLTKESIV